jgi:hypothetical protein
MLLLPRCYNELYQWPSTVQAPGHITTIHRQFRLHLRRARERQANQSIRQMPLLLGGADQEQRRIRDLPQQRQNQQDEHAYERLPREGDEFDHKLGVWGLK